MHVCKGNSLKLATSASFQRVGYFYEQSDYRDVVLGVRM